MNPLNNNPPLDIMVPIVVIPENGGTLTWGEMVVDTVKVTKGFCDPVSECVGCVAGSLCCVAALVVQAKKDDRPATRHDVVYAKDIRRRERAKQGAAYEVGYCIGDCMVDSSAVVIGGGLGVIRATILSLFGKNPKRENPVLGLVDRKNVDETQLFDSCACIGDCFS